VKPNQQSGSQKSGSSGGFFKTYSTALGPGSKQKIGKDLSMEEARRKSDEGWGYITGGGSKKGSTPGTGKTAGTGFA
jgi:hypothetical protein